MGKKFVGQEYMAATNGKGLHQQSKGNRVLSRLTMIGSVFITVVSVFIVAFCLFFQMCPVNGTSMMTTLNATGEKNKEDKVLTCSLGKPKNGDIVVMKLYAHDVAEYADLAAAAKGDQTALNKLHITQQAAINTLLNDRFSEYDGNGYYELIIKRLIGQPGDCISMRCIDDEYFIYLNGEKLNETYLDPMVASHDKETLNFKRLWRVLHKTPDAYDIRNWPNYTKYLAANQDSVVDGIGIASDYMLIIPDGYYFVVGDNRGSNSHYPESWDSIRFGPLPITNYCSSCVDILDHNTTMPKYLWQQFVYYVCFGWAWQK